MFSGEQPSSPGPSPYPGQSPYSTWSQYPNMHKYNNYSLTNGDDTSASFAFTNKKIRLAFIRKVYAILTAQLAVTGFFIVLFIASSSCTEFVAENPALVWITMGVTIITSLVLLIFKSLARRTPINYIFLFAFTIAEGFLLGVLAANCGTVEVLLAIGITALICFSLTVYAFQTKIDFTASNSVLLVFLLVFSTAGMILLLVPTIELMQMMYSCIGVVIFSLFLVSDTQQMIDGDHEYILSPEDYIFAALAIYMDIVNIFIHLLRFLTE